VRITSPAFLVAIHGQGGSANCERTGRLKACCPRFAADCHPIKKLSRL